MGLCKCYLILPHDLTKTTHWQPYCLFRLIITRTQDYMVQICILIYCQVVGLHGRKVSGALLIAFPAQLMAVAEAVGVSEPVYAKL